MFQHFREFMRQAATQPVRFPLSGLLLLVFLTLDWVLLRIIGFCAGDWSPLWAAGRLSWSDPSRLYDFAYLTRLQAPILENVGIRPFVYPPTALLLFAPAALMSFRASFAVMAAGSAFLLALASSRNWTDRILLAASPPVVFAMMTGQPNLLVAMLAALGMMRLKSSEASAGALFAAAALIKPTVLLLLPVGLIAGRHRRAIASGTATAAALLTVSILFFGFSPWLAWIEALPRFRDVFDAYPALYRNGVTPYALALRTGAASSWIPLTILAPVIVATAAAFIRSSDWTVRFVTVVGGSLLVSPYAMHYELAALAPVVVAMRREKPVDLVVPLLWAGSLFVNASLVGLTAVYIWALVRVIASPEPRAEPRGLIGGEPCP